MTRTLATLILSGSLAFAAATMVQARPMTMPGASDTGFEVVDASASRASRSFGTTMVRMRRTLRSRATSAAAVKRPADRPAS